MELSPMIEKKAVRTRSRCSAPSRVRPDSPERTDPAAFNGLKSSSGSQSRSEKSPTPAPLPRRRRAAESGHPVKGVFFDSPQR